MLVRQTPSRPLISLGGAIFLAIAGAATAPASAQSIPEGSHSDHKGPYKICDLEADTIQGLQSAVLAQPGVEVLQTPTSDYVAYAIEKKEQVWTFATPSNFAYPAVVCREAVQNGGRVDLRMKVGCHSTRKRCEQLVRDFMALNEQAKSAIAEQQKKSK